MAVLCAGLSLGGCGSLNTILSTSMADLVPHWAGGLPPDAPPRPGDPRYDEFERAQRARALVPPSETGNAETNSSGAVEEAAAQPL